MAVDMPFAEVSLPGTNYPCKGIFWFRLPLATKVPRGRPSPCWGVEENGKKQAENGGSG